MYRLLLALLAYHLSFSFCLAQANSSPRLTDEKLAQLAQKIQSELEYGLLDSAYQHSVELFSLAQQDELKYFQGKALQLQSNYFLNIGKQDTMDSLLSLALSAAKEIQSKELEANTFISLSKLKMDQGLPTEALNYAEAARTIFEEIEDENGQSAVEYQIGRVLQHQGNWTDAIEHYSASLLLATRVENDNLMAASLIGIGSMNELQNDLTTGTSLYRKAGKLYEKINNQYGLSKVYNRLGNIAIGRQEYDTAALYYQKAINIGLALGAKEVVAGLLFNMSLVNQFTGNLDAAWLFADSAFAIANEINNNVLILETKAQYGFISIDKGDFKNAILFGNEALELAQNTENNAWIMNCAELLVDAYKATGNYKKALEMQDLYTLTHENILSEESQRKVIRQQFQFTYEKKAFQDSVVYAQRNEMAKLKIEKSEANLSKQRVALFGSGVAIVLLILLLYTIRKGKRRSDELLLNILPEEIAQELKEKGRADARDFDMVSILFTDFKSFTQASAALSAQELVAEINVCFEAFDHIIEKYNVEKIKTIGDAYMAAGGLPVPTDDSVKNTVLAALEMQAFISKRKTEMDAAVKPAFEMRVGIHTGPVVAGIVGVKKFQYDIWGDTVNTASRIESMGEVGKVNISQATYELLQDDPQFAFESRGKIEAKGKGEIEMWFVEKEILS